MQEPEYKSRLRTFFKCHDIKYVEEVSNANGNRADFVIKRPRYWSDGADTDVVAIEVKAYRGRDEFDRGLGQAIHYLAYWPSSWYAIPNGWVSELKEVVEKAMLPLEIFGLFDLDSMKLVTFSESICPLCYTDPCKRCNILTRNNRVVILNRFQKKTLDHFQS